MTEVRLKRGGDVGRRGWKKEKRGARGSSSVWKLTFLLVLVVPLTPSARGSVKPLPGGRPVRTVLQVAAAGTRLS
jgi:hypothetical protein